MIRYRKGVGAVIFARTPKGLEFLVFHRIKNWRGWELAKGGLLEGEPQLKGLKREIREETGIKKYKIYKGTCSIKYKWPRAYIKDHQKFNGANHKFYLVEVKKCKIKIDCKEHDKCRWVSKTEALKLLTHDNHKRLFRCLTRDLI